MAKNTPKGTISFEELLSGQQRFKEKQKREAETKESITLEDLKKLQTGMSLDDLKNLQSNKQTPNKTNLGTLHQDLKSIKQSLDKTTTGEEPMFGRRAVATFFPPLPTKETAAPQAPEQQAPQEPPRDLNKERTERLQKIGSVIQEKIGVERGGALNNTQTNINKNVYDKFIAQTKQHDEILKDASEQQVQIFKQFEKTLIELREAGSDDSKKLREQLQHLAGQLETTEHTTAKGRMGYEMQTALGNARPKNLGDMFKSLFGGERRVREGYEKEGKNYRNKETGQFVKSSEATKGRLASAVSFLGEYIRSEEHTSELQSH